MPSFSRILRVPRVPSQHALELLARHRPASPATPLRLGSGDELGSEALVQALAERAARNRAARVCSSAKLLGFVQFPILTATAPVSAASEPEKSGAKAEKVASMTACPRANGTNPDGLTLT